MFSLFNGIYDSYLAPSQLNILVVGGPLTGKSALLERLKVTEIPTRPKGGGNGTNSKTVQNRLGAEALSMTLHSAFVETGAVDIVGRRKSSILLLTRQQPQSQRQPPHLGDNNTGNNNIKEPQQQTQQATSTPSRNSYNGTAVKSGSTPIVASGNVVVIQKKKRFHLNICPAPERYTKSAQDQDEDFVEDEHGDASVVEETKKLLSRDGTPATDSAAVQKRLFEEEIMSGINKSEGEGSLSDPPRRVRCHSKEFNMDSLDLMDGRNTSLQEIPLEESGAVTSSVTSEKSSSTRSSILPGPTVQGSPLVQPNAEEYDLRYKAKMLPLEKIRPTSK
jgi:hypothetical protein